jgi:hypothetical protein
MIWPHKTRPKLELDFMPHQYLGVLLLAAFLTTTSALGSRAQNPVPLFQAQAVAPPPVPETAQASPELSALIALNRQAAAQVARIGLLTTGQRRMSAARHAASWMAWASGALPQVGTGDFTARQRALLDAWRLALEDYDLAQVRAVSKANAGLYAEMDWVLGIGD